MKHLRIHTTNLSNGNCKLGLKKDFVEYLKVSKRRNKMEKELTTAQRELIKGANITPLLRASSDSIFNEISIPILNFRVSSRLFIITSKKLTN